jgi:hypothetical protein
MGCNRSGADKQGKPASILRVIGFSVRANLPGSPDQPSKNETLAASLISCDELDRC